MKKLLVFFIAFAILLFATQHAFADDKFTTSATTTYAVNESGVTHTTMHVVIHNITSNFYVTSYTLQVGFNNITNIKASDSHGAIVPVVEKDAEGEQIQLQFNSIVYGTGTSLPFTISFDTTDIATHNGSVWEINIPGLANQTDFTDFTVEVAVPNSFGKATYIKPDLPSNSLTFTKNQLGDSGISLAFGQQQTYAFNLLYHLQNTNVFPVKTEIAIPPTTNYQTISLNSLNPKPTEMRMDSDGNWLAQYSLSPGKTVTVSASGEVGVSLYPKKEVLSGKDRSLYLKSQLYWQVDDKTIQELAKKLKAPQQIYDYVVSHLRYDFSRVGINQERLGAADILKHPSQAVCLEFTDLFIALSRAAGIPAREVDGYAYTQNTKERPLSRVQDVLHAWPEYYNDATQQWVMVDPTWGNTTGGVDYFHTLDFDHVAFVIKGTSSNYPVPAGGYKLPGHQNDKDISVSFSEQPIATTPEVSATIFMDNSYLSGFPVSGNITLTNNGTLMFPSQMLSLSTHHLRPYHQTVTVPAVLPYQHVSVPLSFDKTPFLTNMHDEVTIGFAGKTYTKSLDVVRLTRNQLLIGGGIILVVLSIIVLVIATKTWSIPTAGRR